ncbi:amidophosphoribosyltransferase [Elusimicrobium posterum]|uniref:amidophosphoribosyltransferase n=1 Tax=Elusimicrobium posterum TaxID=3116653 RepID=UPI003C722BBB
MCGVFGIENHKNASAVVLTGLMSLQHRGQESAGIASYSKEHDWIRLYCGTGYVSYIFKEKDADYLRGTSAVGHVRYATAGRSGTLENVQPFVFECKHGQIALAHNGNIANDKQIADKLQKSGAIFAHSSDSEHIMHLIEREPGNLEGAIPPALKKLNGAFALIFIQGEKMIGVRDPYGIRSLVLGKKGNSYILSSETIAIELCGGKIIRDLAPGEMIVIEKGKIKKSFIYEKKKKEAVCVFEQVYFSMPASVVNDKSVAEARMDMGRALARQMKGIEADVVMPVPESGLYAAMGYAKEAGIPMELGLVRNHYLGRSFIMPTQELRENIVKLKLFPIKEKIEGKRIVLIDDSLVRGTTSKKIVKLLRETGAKEIHFVLSSPKVVSPCFYGIDTPTKQELIAHKMTTEQMRDYMGADSLTFITLDNMKCAASSPKKQCTGFCSACFDGKYPTGLKLKDSTQKSC